ncbi:MAG: hypothetical protein ISS81_07925 [Candidatus Marinimicrobia bacterium]|nr:hypothetical protein [Candidatus Neomarinimicrobiota bacterium]
MTHDFTFTFRCGCILNVCNSVVFFCSSGRWRLYRKRYVLFMGWAMGLPRRAEVEEILTNS